MGKQKRPRPARAIAAPPDVPATMGAGAFKSRCLEILDRVAATRRPVVITKRGRPVARLIPELPAEAADEFFGRLAGDIRILGEIVAPTVPAEDWAEIEREADEFFPAPPPR